MSLNQSDRIAISKAYIDVPTEISQIEKNKALIEADKVKLEAKDLANKNLVDRVTNLINPYQTEFALKNGQLRTVLTEQIIADAAERKIGNFLFPNEQNVPLPSVPDGIWKYYSPFFGSYGVGKQKLETFGAQTPYEQNLIASINAQIAIIETYTSIQRITGQACITAANPSPPPVTVETISNEPALQAAMTTLITNVTDWQAVLTSTQTALTGILAVDTNSTRVAQVSAEQASVSSVLAAITTWLSLPTFNTSHGQSTCSGFNSFNAATLAPTKGYVTQLDVFKASVASRTTQVTTRLSQLSSHLGSVSQDPSNGDINGGSGFYLDRARALNLRIHALGGSLTAVKSAEKGLAGLNQFKKNKEDAISVYNSVMVVSVLKAPANGTNNLHLKDSASFNTGDTVYIVSESQPEIRLTVQEKIGDRIVVDTQISSTYREDDKTRVYKIL